MIIILLLLLYYIDIALCIYTHNKALIICVDGAVKNLRHSTKMYLLLNVSMSNKVMNTKIDIYTLFVWLFVNELINKLGLRK